MSDLVFYVGLVWLAILLGIVVLRLARARTLGQRILALDLLTLVLIGLLALAAGEDERAYALDAALALALLSFVATLAACRYYEDRRPFS
ncbi:MAG TPA: monovalent cation/H+ antiporter complex subunit F [Solirubrobacteraceae bacterium]|nr:monovalent cation/H+ antiporter complex subunit F [Solirubrobacteraceae bacterium]